MVHLNVQVRHQDDGMIEAHCPSMPGCRGWGTDIQQAMADLRQNICVFLAKTIDQCPEVELFDLTCAAD